MKSNFYIKKDKLDDTLYVYYQQEYIGRIQQNSGNVKYYCQAIPADAFGNLSFYHTNVEGAIISLVCSHYERGGRKVEEC